MSNCKVIGFIDLQTGKVYGNKREYELEKLWDTMEGEPVRQVVDAANTTGCPHCGSYEGDATECPECGHGQ